MANWLNNLGTGLGNALIGVNNPFGLAPPEGFDRNAAMRQGALSLGMNVLANADQNPAVALGRGYRQAQAIASDNQQNAMAAEAMMAAAAEKKRKRQEEEESKAQFEQFVSTLPPDQQPLARMFPEKFGAAVIGQKFPDPQGGGSANVGLTPIWVKNKKTGQYGVGQLSDNGLVLNGQAVNGTEWDVVNPYDLNQQKAAGTAEGKVIGGAKGVLSSERSNAEFVKGKIDDVINDPALESGVGWASYIPDGMASNKLIGFRTKLAEINSQAFLQARTMLRGGGAITDFESRKAEEAYSAAQIAIRSGDPQTLKDALGRFKEAIDAGMAKLEAQAGGGSAPSAGGATTEDPLGLR